MTLAQLAFAIFLFGVIPGLGVILVIDASFGWARQAGQFLALAWRYIRD